LLVVVAVDALLPPLSDGQLATGRPPLDHLGLVCVEDPVVTVVPDVQSPFVLLAPEVYFVLVIQSHLHPAMMTGLPALTLHVRDETASSDAILVGVSVSFSHILLSGKRIVV